MLLVGSLRTCRYYSWPVEHLSLTSYKGTTKGEGDVFEVRFQNGHRRWLTLLKKSFLINLQLNEAVKLDHMPVIQVSQIQYQLEVEVASIIIQYLTWKHLLLCVNGEFSFPILYPSVQMSSQTSTRQRIGKILRVIFFILRRYTSL